MEIIKVIRAVILFYRSIFILKLHPPVSVCQAFVCIGGFVFPSTNTNDTFQRPPLVTMFYKIPWKHLTWLHQPCYLLVPGRSNHKEILLAWGTWWKSAACGNPSVQRLSCFLATLPIPRFLKCFWMGGLSEFWSLFLVETMVTNSQKPTGISENRVRFEGFENPPRIHSFSNFAVLFLLKKIRRHLDG